MPDPGARPKQVVGALINGIAEALPDPVALILDDLHHITEPAVYTALDYLAERLPSQLHLVAISRHDPPLALPRLRARGELAELRFADLRFTLDETMHFLAKLRLELPTEQVAALQLPLPTARWHPEEGDARAEVVRAVLAEEGLELRDMQVKGARELFFSRR